MQAESWGEKQERAEPLSNEVGETAKKWYEEKVSLKVSPIKASSPDACRKILFNTKAIFDPSLANIQSSPALHQPQPIYQIRFSHTCRSQAELRNIAQVLLRGECGPASLLSEHP